MKIDILRELIGRGLIGYLFLLVLGGACIAIGIVAFGNNVPSAIFSVIVGLILIGLIYLSLRKN